MSKFQNMGGPFHEQHKNSFKFSFYFDEKISFFPKFLVFIVIFIHSTYAALGPIAYKGHLSDLRIQELHNIAHQIELSVNEDKHACDGYYDFVCSRNMPMYSILGHLPNITEIMQLMTELQQDHEHFEAKQKINDFFVACNVVHRVEDCYRESFEYFKPIFGYIITKYHIDSSSHDHQNFLEVLGKFLSKAERTEDFARHPIRMKLASLRDHFRKPHLYFRISDLNREYKELRIYRESYEHNLRNLEQHSKRNSTYEVGIQRVMLDWTLYVFQSRNKPMSYYFPTLNVHLWMTLYNSTVRYYEPRRLQEIADCLNLPQHVNMLGEARLLAVVYLKSFRNAWNEYTEWISASTINHEIHDQENEILRQHKYLTNKKIFYILYAQNFCDFGKELAEHIFYIGLRQNFDFLHIYCGDSSEPRTECVP